MKPHRHSYIDDIGLAVLKKVLAYGTLGITLGLVFLIIHLDEKYKIKAAKFVAVVVFVSGFGIALYSVPEIIGRMKRDSAMLLSDAVVHTFYSHMMLASFVPVVGPLFGRFIERRKKTNPFTEEGKSN